MAALPVDGGDEVIYVGMRGAASGGTILPGHVLSATIDPHSSAMPVWQDLTLNPVTNSPNSLNKYGLDISSIFVDSHDPTGQTVYVTAEGFSSASEPVETVNGSTDGGAHWASYMSNLPPVPVSSVVVDPQSAGTVYLATDAGVYFTTNISSCVVQPSYCWQVFGNGLPGAPVVALGTSPPGAVQQLLTAGTYGRGVWQTPLCSASGAGSTSASESAMQLAFSSQAVGTASAPLTLTVTNTGSNALAISSIGMSDSIDFSETDNCVGGSVAPAASCTVNVTFKPGSAGSLMGEMAIYANVCGGQLTENLTGIGTSGSSQVTFSPNALLFGDVPDGTTATLTVGVNTQIQIMSVTVSSLFTIVSSSCGANLTLPATCQVTVGFTPAARGPATGALTFTDSAGTQIVGLTGTGQAPATDVLSALSLPFPTPTAVGQNSAAQSILLSNSGDLPLTGIATCAGAGATTAASCIAGPPTGEFTVMNTCNGQLAGPGNCAINVVFSPTATGMRTGTLWVYDALGTKAVALSGTGVQPATLSVSSTSSDYSSQSMSLNFPSQDVQGANASVSLTITNSGGVAAGIVGFGIPGALVPGSPASSFSTGLTTCTAPLASGGACTVQVIFNPVTAGGNSASLNIAALGAKPVTVTLNGAGVAPSGLNVSPAQMTFAPTVVGSASAAQTVTVSNRSSVAASQLMLAVTGVFTLSQNTCTGSLAEGASCSAGVVFDPAAIGAATGTFSVMSATIGNLATVELAGTGALAANLQVTPATISFATTGVGQTSSVIPVTVTNTGIAAALSNLALAIPAGFQLVNNTCAASLGPGASCTTGVEFVPTAAGAVSGNLAVTSSTLITSVPLQGAGFDFTVAVSGSSIQSVASGLNASYTLVLTPLNGSSGTFSFACNSLPANALCSFNPTGETLNSGASGNVVVQVATGSAASGIRRKNVWGVVPLVCALLLLPLGWKKGRLALRGAVLIGLLAILMGGVASCAGSGGGTGGTGVGVGGANTAPGTYSIPVTVTSTGVSHNASLTLTVD
jgi:hypothetical protein